MEGSGGGGSVRGPACFRRPSSCHIRHNRKISPIYPIQEAKFRGAKVSNAGMRHNQDPLAHFLLDPRLPLLIPPNRLIPIDPNRRRSPPLTIDCRPAFRPAALALMLLSATPALAQQA